MKKLIAIAVVLLGAIVPSMAKVRASMPARIKNGTIVLKTPDVPKDRQSALKMTAEPIANVRIGIVGVGSRGGSAAKRLCYVPGCEVVAVCDLEQDNINKVQKRRENMGLSKCREYLGEDAYKDLCQSPDIDLVYICTDWKMHTPVAVYAMEHGKHAAIEVPAATSIAECWQLVSTCEKTRRHCMMLENCCYDFFEATTLNMIRQGVFGEMLYGEGAYIHNLNPFWDEYHADWRLAWNRTHRGDNYPTHGIGPICQAFGIHRGDRMERVVTMDTRTANGISEANKRRGWSDFADGDHTTSLIRTAKGKVIEIQHNVYGSRPYSRIHSITGTDGYITKYPKENISIDGKKLGGDFESIDAESFLSDELREKLLASYEPEFIKEIKVKAKEVGGHGGMDYIMDYRLIYCLNNGLPLDEDVYDAAEWSCLTELSRISIENGNMPVEVPDFTRGEWDKIQGFNYEFAK